MPDARREPRDVPSERATTWESLPQYLREALVGFYTRGRAGSAEVRKSERDAAQRDLLRALDAFSPPAQGGVREAVIEECARVCDEKARGMLACAEHGDARTCWELAAAIRALSAAPEATSERATEAGRCTMCGGALVLSRNRNGRDHGWYCAACNYFVRPGTLKGGEPLAVPCPRDDARGEVERLSLVAQVERAIRENVSAGGPHDSFKTPEVDGIRAAAVAAVAILNPIRLAEQRASAAPETPRVGDLPASLAFKNFGSPPAPSAPKRESADRGPS